MDELIENEAVTEPIEDTIATDAQEATDNAPEAEEVNDNTPEEETQQKPEKRASLSMEERMLEMLLRESHPDTLKTALENGKTIRGAWKYVVSVMKNAYITQNGRVNGGMCGTPELVVEIAERYLREFPEGYTEPEAKHEPKPKTNAKAEVIKTVKKAAKDAKESTTMQLSLF
jgi:hypothetical protein